MRAALTPKQQDALADPLRTLLADLTTRTERPRIDDL